MVVAIQSNLHRWELRHVGYSDDPRDLKVLLGRVLGLRRQLSPDSGSRARQKSLGTPKGLEQRHDNSPGVRCDEREREPSNKYRLPRVSTHRRGFDAK